MQRRFQPHHLISKPVKCRPVPEITISRPFFFAESRITHPLLFQFVAAPSPPRAESTPFDLNTGMYFVSSGCFLASSVNDDVPLRNSFDQGAKLRRCPLRVLIVLERTCQISPPIVSCQVDPAIHRVFVVGGGASHRTLSRWWFRRPHRPESIIIIIVIVIIIIR